MLSPLAMRRLVSIFMLATAGCSGCPKADVDVEAGAAARAPTDEPAGFIGDASVRFRDAEPQIARLLADGGDGGDDDATDPACTGAAIALADAIADPRCAIGGARAKALRARLEGDASKLPLRQEAAISPDGVVSLRLANTGKSALALPLSHHPKLPAFTVLAEDDKHAIYELAPPRFEVADAGADKARFARIVLPPGGVATATITVAPSVVRRVAPACAEGGSCAPERLPRGRYTLYVGELLTDVEAGAPARVAWEIR
ncbi:MAG: hypothetical protein KF819_00980 [Labilithrix sp.]|nr:hypothetical protein [Labilithrix sp.]